MSEEPKLIPEGRHLAVIQNIDLPDQSQFKPGHHIRIRVQVGSQHGFMAVGGYLDAVLMIYESREYWIGRTISVMVKHRAIDDRIYQTIDVRKWKPEIKK